MKKLFFLCICSITLLGVISSQAKAQTITGAWHMPITCNTSLDTGHIYEGGYTAGDSVIIDFGDGTILRLPPYYVSGTMAQYHYAHNYTVPGTYTVFALLTVGGVPVDTVTYTHDYKICNNIQFYLYTDNNSNCVFDGGDSHVPLNATNIKVDSAGVPVDTFVTNYGYNYEALGPAGTVYSFTVIGSPHGLMPTCPSTGTVSVTITSTATTYNTLIGFECDPSACLDWSLYNQFRAAATRASAYMTVYSSTCTPVSTTVTLTFSPKYTPDIISGGTSHSVSGNVITFNVTSSADEYTAIGVSFLPVGTLTMGDTVHTTFAISTAGDCNPSNNVVLEIDTIKASWDPNEKKVQPGGNIAEGTELKYTLHFENLGNDTAYNVYLLDTLSGNLDIRTIKQVASSAPCTMTPLTWGGYHVVRFDLQNIKLLDSSHHPGREGYVAFTIKAKTPLAPGTHIDNRAGIYFDYNPVVMTNWVRNTIGLPSVVQDVKNDPVAIYPNPVNDELFIHSPAGTYQSFTITNMIGKMMISRPFGNNHTSVNVKSLPAGIYYITLRGEGGVKVQKFEKL